MKIIFTLLLSLIFTFTITAQENCHFTNSPAVLGLKLNMAPEEAQSVVGNSLKIKVKTNEEKTIFQNYIKESPPASLTGVRAIYLRFYDRKLYQIEVFYQENPSIKTLEDFTNLLSAKWNFPASDWQREEIKSIINCADFSVVAIKILNPRVELTNEIARAKVEAERGKESKK